MKLAIVSPVTSLAGGIGRVVEEQAKRLAGRGHEVTVFVPEGRAKGKGQRAKVGEQTTIEGVTVTAVRPWFRYGHGAWIPGIGKLLGGFDVIHLHYPFLGGALAVAAWRKKTKQGKLVITYHMDLIGRGIFNLFFRAYQKLLMPRIICSADDVTVSSKDYAIGGDLSPLMSKISRHLFEIPFGVDSRRFKPGEPDVVLKKKLGIESDESVILFVGGLDRAHYFKGVPILIKAFADLCKEARNVRLLIVGQGDLLPRYKILAKNLKIDRLAIFADNVSAEDLPHYYNLADVSVLPSIDRSEAFGIVLLEAQSSGVPVIASDLPGVRTVIEDRKTGFLVPPKNKKALTDDLAWILTQNEERILMGHAARERILEKYQWENIIEKLEKVYNMVTGNR